MVCIYCNAPTQVINSRHQKRGNAIWRRRQCHECSAIFTSREQVDLAGSFRVQQTTNDRRLAPFHRDRLFIDIYESCKHRPTALGDATALTQTIIDKLRLAAKDGLLTQLQIVTETLAVLKRFDTAAASAYGAYHPPKK